jgi:hypothetical protein
MFELLHKYFEDKTGICFADFLEIKPYFKLRTVKRNENILSEGDVCDFNSFVNRGCLKF